MICPYCRDPLPARLEATLACTACGTAVHGECAVLHGGCVTFACEGNVFQPLTAQPRRRRLDPRMPFSVHLRRELQDALALALAPREDLALLVLGAVGVVGLALSSGLLP